MQKLNLKKFFLYLLIASVSLSAILGIAVILIGNFGEFESRVLLSTLTVICTSVLGLACGASLEAKRGRIFPLAGIGLAVLSAFLWLIVIWYTESISPTLGKSLISTTLLSVSFSHLSLISLARLDPRFRWALISVFVSVGSLSALILVLIWWEGVYESDVLMRILGVLAIIVAALTIVIPVFHKLSDNILERSGIDAEIDKLKRKISELEKRKSEIPADESA